MVAMLMSDQDSIKCVGGFANCGEAPFQFPKAKPGVDEDTGAIRSDERHVPRTAAGQNAELYDVRFSLCFPPLYH